MLNALNRQAETTTRARGRPKNDEPKSPPQSVETVALSDVVLPMICVACGRGMMPQILRRRPDGRRDCRCGSCGVEFIYAPATVTRK